MMNNLTSIQFLTIIPNKGANQLFLKWDFFFGTEEVNMLRIHLSSHYDSPICHIT